MIFRLGIGDILITKMVFDEHQINKKFKIYLPFIESYREGSEEYLKFIEKLIVKLFGENSYQLTEKNAEIFDNYYYGSINIYNNNIVISKFDLDIKNKHDFKLFMSLKGKRYDYSSIKKIVHLIQDNLERNYIYNSLEDFKDYHYEFDIFHTNMKHSLKISKVIKYKNHNFLYIGAGDTIFHGHFITGSGLNRTINFAVKCANFITDMTNKFER